MQSKTALVVVGLDAPKFRLARRHLLLHTQFLQPRHKHLLAPASSILPLPDTRHRLICLQSTHSLYLILHFFQEVCILRARLPLLELRTTLEQDVESADEARGRVWTRRRARALRHFGLRGDGRLSLTCLCFHFVAEFAMHIESEAKVKIQNRKAIDGFPLSEAHGLGKQTDLSFFQGSSLYDTT